MKFFLLSTLPLLLALVLTSCTRQKDTFQGNAEAYSGLRPKDGQYVWFDSRVSCTKDGKTESGYRGVITVAGSAPIQFRAACSDKSIEVKPKDLQVTEVSEVGSGTQIILQYANGVYDPANDVSTPPSTGTTRAWANFPVTGSTYEIIIRAGGTVENMVDGRALISSKVTDVSGAVTSTFLSSVPVTTPISQSDKTVYSGTDFNLTIDAAKQGTDVKIVGTFAGKISGQTLNLTTRDVANTFLTPPPVPAWTLVAGGHFTCATDTKNVWCWGFNGDGQLGNNSFNSSRVPVLVPNVSGRITGLAAGLNHVCAIVNLRVMCWGDNSMGQLGLDPTATPRSPTPVLVQDFGQVAKVVAGLGHTCASAGTTSVPYCWGDNTNGQLGRSPDPQSYIPRVVPYFSVLGVKALSAGARHTCGITNSTGASANCWGDNSEGQLGNNSLSGGFQPVPVSGPTVFQELYASGNTSCGTTSSGNPFCWGSNRYGVASADGGERYDISTPIKTPVDLTSVLGTVTAFAISPVYGCAIKDSGVWCWGRNDIGQFGRAAEAGSPRVAAKIAAWGTPTKLALGAPDLNGFGHSIFLYATGLQTSGLNNYGQLGDNSVTNREAPTSISFPTL